jgi:DNA anti-recombination protein RmuC
MSPDHLNIIIGSSTLLGALVSMWALFTRFSDKLEKRFDKIDERFDKIDQRFEKVDQKFEKIEQEIHTGFSEIRKDLSEVKERISFLEASSIYTMPLEPVYPNPRSQAAKEMWKRRRQKSISNKEENA